MNENAWQAFERELHEAAMAYDGRLAENVVPGEGNRRASIVLIGEAPGAQEDRQGRPFVGPAGRMLDEQLEKVGLQRDAVWITNVVKRRPIEEKDGRTRNRAPSREEFDYFLPWLERELRLIDPEVIVALGATAAKALLGRRSVTMRDLRGEWMPSVLDIEMMVTYHPSFLLRRISQQAERYAEMQSDLALVQQRAGGE